MGAYDSADFHGPWFRVEVAAIASPLLIPLVVMLFRKLNRRADWVPVPECNKAQGGSDA